MKGYLAAPKWSPDGKTIAVLFTENATRASGPLVAETPETGEIKDAFYEQRLAVVDVASGKLRQISPADTYIYEYDWSPDGLRFAVTAALGNGDNNWWIAELYTLEGAGGLMKAIYKPHLQIANPVWSPDGERVAFIEGLMSDEGLTGGDIFTVPAAGGNAEDVTPEAKASASWIAWTPEGKLMVGAIVGRGCGDCDRSSGQPGDRSVVAGRRIFDGGRRSLLSDDFAGQGWQDHGVCAAVVCRAAGSVGRARWAGGNRLRGAMKASTREWGDAKSIRVEERRA